jgi:hypothetical protein
MEKWGVKSYSMTDEFKLSDEFIDKKSLSVDIVYKYIMNHIRHLLTY